MKTFQIDTNMVEESLAGNPARCVLATAFNKILPEPYIASIRHDESVGDWYFVVKKPSSLDSDQDIYWMPDELAEVANLFDDYGDWNKYSFYQHVKDKTFEYPEDLLDFIKQVEEAK